MALAARLKALSYDRLPKMLIPLPVMQLAGSVILQILVAYPLPIIVCPFISLLSISNTAKPKYHAWSLSNSELASNSNQDQRLHTKRSDGATMYIGQDFRLPATALAHMGLSNPPAPSHPVSRPFMISVLLAKTSEKS